MTHPPLWKPIHTYVASLPRCGTFWLCDTLRSLSVQATHEWLQNESKGAWWDGSPNRVEISWMGVPRMEKMFVGTKVIHLVRHPVPCINSILKYGFTNWIQTNESTGESFNARGSHLIDNPQRAYLADALFPAISAAHILENGWGKENLPQLDDPVGLACFFYTIWNREIARQKGKWESSWRTVHAEELWDTIKGPKKIYQLMEDGVLPGVAFQSTLANIRHAMGHARRNESNAEQNTPTVTWETLPDHVKTEAKSLGYNSEGIVDG